MWGEYEGSAGGQLLFLLLTRFGVAVVSLFTCARAPQSSVLPQVFSSSAIFVQGLGYTLRYVHFFRDATEDKLPLTVEETALLLGRRSRWWYFTSFPPPLCFSVFVLSVFLPAQK